MSDEYEYDDGGLDYDDGWLYVDDEFDLPDELAEGQVPEPGYSGTNNEIDMEGYEFDLYEYWDDLAYGDDSYWEYGLPNAKGEDVKDAAGQKRKRGPAKANGSPTKRRKAVEDEPVTGQLEPVIFRSQDLRYRMYKQDAPLVKGNTTFSFLGDWRERFADEEAPIPVVKMPVDMRKAAEGQDETPPKARQLGEEAYAEGDGVEDDWEDEMEDDEDQGGIAIDPEMLKSILREKLGSAGLEGMDEAAFMQTIQKMLSGDGDGDEAAGDLANALLGKLTSGPGDEALSGWLSQQGVALEDDDASSVATGDMAESGNRAGHSRRTLQTSPPDSAVELRKADGHTTQMPLHSSSPIASTKKRPATHDDHQPTKKHKKVDFEVASSENRSVAQEAPLSPAIDEQPETAITSTQTANAAAADANKSASAEVEREEGSKQKGGRKRKASSVDEKPTGKKTKMRELKDLGPLPEAPSPASPAKRTRSARSKAGK